MKLDQIILLKNANTTAKMRKLNEISQSATSAGHSSFVNPSGDFHRRTTEERQQLELQTV
jgi:hypothetical protein